MADNINLVTKLRQLIQSSISRWRGCCVDLSLFVAKRTILLHYNSWSWERTSCFSFYSSSRNSHDQLFLIPNIIALFLNSPIPSLGFIHLLLNSLINCTFDEIWDRLFTWRSQNLWLSICILKWLLLHPPQFHDCGTAWRLSSRSKSDKSCVSGSDWWGLAALSGREGGAVCCRASCPRYLHLVCMHVGVCMSKYVCVCVIQRCIKLIQDYMYTCTYSDVYMYFQYTRNTHIHKVPTRVLTYMHCIGTVCTKEGQPF